MWQATYACCGRYLSDAICHQDNLFPIAGSHTSAQNQRHASKGYYRKITNSAV